MDKFEKIQQQKLRRLGPFICFVAFYGFPFPAKFFKLGFYFLKQSKVVVLVISFSPFCYLCLCFWWFYSWFFLYSCVCALDVVFETLFIEIIRGLGCLFPGKIVFTFQVPEGTGKPRIILIQVESLRFYPAEWMLSPWEDWFTSSSLLAPGCSPLGPSVPGLGPGRGYCERLPCRAWKGRRAPGPLGHICRSAVVLESPSHLWVFHSI